MPKTRSETEHYLLGQPSPLPSATLPTKGEVINYVKWMQEAKGRVTHRTPKASIFHTVAAKVRDMWKDEGIPIYDQKYVVKRIRVEYQAYQNANKKPKSRRGSNCGTRFSQLFDIARCKCRSRRACSCSMDCRIPVEEWSFVRDQRRCRRLSLGAYDRATSASREARFQRRQSRYRHEHSGAVAGGDGGGITGNVSVATTSGGDGADSSHRRVRATDPSAGEGRGSGSCKCGGADTDGADSNDNGCKIPEPTAEDSERKDFAVISSAAEEGCEDDEDFVLPHAALHTDQKNWESLTNAALAAERYGVSNRAAAAIINGFQMDVGRITERDRTKIIDPKKIWRARERVRQETACEAAECLTESGLHSLYFDGRKDRTCAERSSVTAVEEHVVVLSEPGSVYLTHFTPSSGRALDLLNELYSVSLMFDGTVKVLGCDGTAVNTGVNGGVCRLFELVTSMAVHWFVCQLHSNELNLRHLLCALDGTTSGPRSFSGQIGSSCAADVWTLEVVAFHPVPGHTEEQPEDLLKSLSQDQEILLRLALAVQSGSISDSTARRRIGPLNHAR